MLHSPLNFVSFRSSRTVQVRIDKTYRACMLMRPTATCQRRGKCECLLTDYDRLRYNYITSAALDTGLIISTIIIFFSLYLTETSGPKWFGNVGALSTLDMSESAVQSVLPPGETFGPSTWI